MLLLFRLYIFFVHFARHLTKTTISILLTGSRTPLESSREKRAERSAKASRTAFPKERFVSFLVFEEQIEGNDSCEMYAICGEAPMIRCDHMRSHRQNIQNVVHITAFVIIRGQSSSQRCRMKPKY